MRFKDWPEFALASLGVYTLSRVEFGEDLFVLIIGSAEIMIAALCYIHSDA